MTVGNPIDKYKKGGQFMKLYIKSSNEGNALSKLGISQQDWKIIKEWCDNYDPDSSVGFESRNGQWITNPFLDETGRFDLTIDEAIKTYGLDNVKNFCEQVLAQVSTNQIFDIDDDGKYTTFFLYTEGDGYWYWTVDTPVVKEYQGSYEAFVNDEKNSALGSSVAFFDTLEEAIADYNSQS